MNKKVYSGIGTTIGVVILIVMLFNIGSLEIWLLPYFFICLTPIIGCFYGWLLESSKRALVIGGILGLLLGFNPSASTVFIFLSPIFICIKSRKHYLCYILPAAFITIVALVDLIHAHRNWSEITDILIMAFIPVINYIITLTIIYQIFVDEISGYYLHLWYNAIILVALPLAGFAIGKITGDIIEIKKEYERKINEYRSIVEKWKSEGYDVSELEEMLK